MSDDVKEKERLVELKASLKDKLTVGESDIWGIDVAKAIFPDGVSPEEVQKADVVLVKFLRASEQSVPTAVNRIQNTVQWRKDFKVQGILEETFPEDFAQAGFLKGVDMDHRPVMFNVYGVNQSIFNDLEKFLRWRVQQMERGIRALDFVTVHSLTQIHDYHGVSMFSSNDRTKAAARETVKLFGDHYPELLAKKFFINVPWYMSTFYSFLQPLIPAKTAQKFIICSSGYKEELLKVIPVENLLVTYGGLKRSAEGEIPRQLEELIPTKITVNARTFEKVEAKIEQPSDVHWDFVLLDSDIEFTCNFVDSSNKLNTVAEVKKVGHTITSGHYEATSAGTFKFVWDNSYSIFSAKHVFYRFIVVPKD